MLMPVNITDGQVSGVDSLSAAASSVLNWDIDEAGINKPRAALTAYSVSGLTTAQLIGMERWSTYTILVDANRKFQRISDFGPSTAFDLSDSTSATKLQGMKRPTWVVGRQYIYAAGGGQVQRWNNGIPLTEVLTNSPPCTHIASIGQYLVANSLSQPDRYLWSDIGEGVWTTWPAANFSTLTARPDVIGGIFENASRLYIFGERSVQVHEVGADPTLPFDLIGSIDIGLGAPYAFAKLDQQVAFLDHRRRVCIGDPGQAQPVSSAIDANLRGFSTVSDCHMYREDVGQQSSLVVRFPTEARTFVYDLKGQRWKERDYYSAPHHGDYPSTAYAYRAADNAHIVASSATTGALYKLDTTVRTDLSGPLVCERTTGWNDFGTKNRKRSAGQTLIVRRGTAAVNATPGSYEIRKQDDDGPWSAWEFVSIGEPHQYEQKKRVFLAGIFTRRRYGVRVSTSEETALVSLEDDVTDLGRA
jgi:hypothetical protein